MPTEWLRQEQLSKTLKNSEDIIELRITQNHMLQRQEQLHLQMNEMNKTQVLTLQKIDEVSNKFKTQKILTSLFYAVSIVVAALLGGSAGLRELPNLLKMIRS